MAGFPNISPVTQYFSYNTCAVQYSALQYSTVQYCSVQFHSLHCPDWKQKPVSEYSDSDLEQLYDQVHTALKCTALYFTALHCTALHCSAILKEATMCCGFQGLCFWACGRTINILYCLLQNIQSSICNMEFRLT